jgi:carbonic anhydrase
VPDRRTTIKNSFQKILKGYQTFRKKYALGDQSIMKCLAEYGQKPQVMVVSCCDSRVDPALILQCDPGDLFVVRNVANIIPPYERDGTYHGTSAALEFGVCFLKVEHLVLLGHSQCGGIQALLNSDTAHSNDFITNWVSIIKKQSLHAKDEDEYARLALHVSHQNCLTFPWIREKVEQGNLVIHLWFFDIKTGQIFNYCGETAEFQPLDDMSDLRKNKHVES